MAEETITLEFLAEQRRRILAEVLAMRADVAELRWQTSAILESARQLRRLTESVVQGGRP